MNKTWEQLIEEFKKEGFSPDEVNKMVQGYLIITKVVNTLDEFKK